MLNLTHNLPCMFFYLVSDANLNLFQIPCAMPQVPRVRLSHQVAMQMEPPANSHSFTKMFCITNALELIIKENSGVLQLTIMIWMRSGEIVQVLKYLC